MSLHHPASIRAKLPPRTRIAIAAARFNAHIVDELLRACVARLEALGVRPAQIAIHRVPGAFELPLAAQTLARSGKFAAVICLGAVIRGQTPHFDFVAGECARGIQEVALRQNLPVIFGVLTTENERQAMERIGRGNRDGCGGHAHAGVAAAEAAVEMIAFQHGVKRGL